jgi:hypothetical protein
MKITVDGDQNNYRMRNQFQGVTQRAVSISLLSVITDKSLMKLFFYFLFENNLNKTLTTKLSCVECASRFGQAAHLRVASNPSKGS